MQTHLCAAQALWCRHVQGQHRLLLSRQVKVQLRPLWNKHSQEQQRTLRCKHRCSSGHHGVDMSRPAQTPVVQTLPGASSGAYFVDMSTCSKGLCSVHTPRCSSGPYGVGISRPAQAPVIQTLPGAAQGPVLLTRPDAAKASLL